MAPQLWIFYLFVVLALVIFAVFAFVARTTREPRDVDGCATAAGFYNAQGATEI